MVLKQRGLFREIIRERATAQKSLNIFVLTAFFLGFLLRRDTAHFWPFEHLMKFFLKLKRYGIATKIRTLNFHMRI